MFGQSAWGQDQAERRSGPVPGRFVVKLKSSVKGGAIQQALSGQLRLSPVSQPNQSATRIDANQWEQVYQGTVADTSATLETVRNMIGPDQIEYIEPDYYLEFYDVPSDPLFNQQWYLNNTGQPYLGVAQLSGPGNDFQTTFTGVPGINIDYMDQLLTPPTDTTPLVVSVIDGGIDLAHPEMQGRLWKNPDEIPFNGLDDDHNGFVDDTMGWDLSGDIADILNIQPDNDPTDFDGHGSHIAGIIAANADGYGIAGIAPFVKLLAVKTRPNATSSVGAAGIVYSVNSGARVINISWGTPFESLILKEAIDYARTNGVFVAIAAGNSGDNERAYPAAFDSSFAVGAINSSGYLTSFSTWGGHIDMVAPGLDILSIRAAGTDLYADGAEPGSHIVSAQDNDSLYFLANGTSMAAPMVAGVAALLWSYRPDLSLNELEEALWMGGDDMVDPFNQGDSYPGTDTISGYGMLNMTQSLEFIIYGGIHFVTPIRNQRYDAPFEIRIAPSGGYTGSWSLYYSTGSDPENYIQLSSGGSVPGDSVAYYFDPIGVNDRINLKLVDNSTRETLISFYYVTGEGFALTSPVSSGQYKYDMPFDGSCFGPEYDSLAIYYRPLVGSEVRISGATKEFYNEHIYTWNISGLEPGNYDMLLYSYFGATRQELIVPVEILSSYTAGWPRQLSGRGGLSAVAADLNADGFKELFVATVMGVNGFAHNGQPLPNWPVLPEQDLRGVPAAYDIDRDGEIELLVTDEAGLHAFNYDGTELIGFPVAAPSNVTNAGYPVPTVTRLGEDADSAITFIATNGIEYAYEFNGDSYFYSLEGWYAYQSATGSPPFYNSSVTVSSADLNGNGRTEVVATYSGNLVNSGLQLLLGRNAQPATGAASPTIMTSSGIYGTLLVDIDGDNLKEVVANGIGPNGKITIWALDEGLHDVPGWPVTIEGSNGWLSSPVNVADLDLDGSPEVILTLHEFDIGSIYIFKADGTPYVIREGFPDGEVVFEPVTLGPPIIADLVGDNHPEIVVRSGYILPGTGPEKLYLLDYTGLPVSGWPIVTATSPSTTFSTPFAPLVDDIDNDGLVELVLVGEGNDLFVWDMTAPSNGGANLGRLYHDNRNSNIVEIQPMSGPVPAAQLNGRVKR